MCVFFFAGIEVHDALTNTKIRVKVGVACIPCDGPASSKIGECNIWCSLRFQCVLQLLYMFFHNSICE